VNFNHNCLILLFSLTFTLLYSTTAVSDSSSPDINKAANTSYHGIYKNKTVTLSDGQWSGSPFVSGSASRPTVGLIKNFTFSGDMDNNGSNEQIVFLWESSGGSGTQIYMAVLASHAGKTVNIATQLVGDRVQLVMGRVDKGHIELDVIQSGKNDAACCPTSKVLRTWSLNNNNKDIQLLESKAQILGEISLADLGGREWHLVKMNWRETLVENTKITMIFNDSKISGKSGCNRYFATIKSGEKPNDIIIDDPVGTRMACPKDIMEQEVRFLKALPNVNSYYFVNGQLALSWKDEGVNSSMLFTSQ